MSRPSRIFRVNFLFSAFPSSAQEARYILRNLSLLHPMISCQYAPVDPGKLSIRYPREVTVWYRVEEFQDFFPRIRLFGGIPRLSFYKKLFEHQGLEKYHVKKELEPINKESPLIFKNDERSLDMSPRDYFLVVKRHHEYYDMKGNKGGFIASGDAKKRLDYITQGIFGPTGRFDV